MEPELEPREPEPFQNLQNSETTESRERPTPEQLLERIKTLTVIRSCLDTRDGLTQLSRMLAEREPELKPEIDLDATQAPEPAPSAGRPALTGPMAEFGEPEVRRWLGTVDGLTAEQLASVRATLADEEEYDGQELLSTTSKSFRRLLRGTGAEAAVPLLLAARDAFVEAGAHRDDPPPPPVRGPNH
jgi:hypothetical protein